MSDRSTSSASTDEKPALFRISKAFCGCAWECPPWSVLEKQERFVSTLMAECKIGPYRRGGAADDFFERDSSEDRMHGMLEDVQQTVHKLVTQVNQQNQLSLSLEDQKAEICDSQQVEATASPLSAPVPRASCPKLPEGFASTVCARNTKCDWRLFQLRRSRGNPHKV